MGQESFDSYRSLLIEHLEEEERDLVPQMRRCFTQAEERQACVHPTSAHHVSVRAVEAELARRAVGESISQGSGRSVRRPDHHPAQQEPHPCSELRRPPAQVLGEAIDHCVEHELPAVLWHLPPSERRSFMTKARRRTADMSAGPPRGAAGRSCCVCAASPEAAGRCEESTDSCPAPSDSMAALCSHMALVSVRFGAAGRGTQDAAVVGDGQAG